LWFESIPEVFLNFIAFSQTLANTATKLVGDLKYSQKKVKLVFVGGTF
jgi:hypothetical protein